MLENIIVERLQFGSWFKKIGISFRLELCIVGLPYNNYFS